MASNPGRIPAGGKDVISIEVNTHDRGGTKLHKRFVVTTNDPTKQRIELQVTGTVLAFVSITPRYIRLIGSQDKKLSSTVSIIPQKEYPFKIKEFEAKEGTNVRVELKPAKNKEGMPGYELTVTNTKTEPGYYRDRIIIQTDLKEKPTITIPVNGRILAKKSTSGGHEKQKKSE